MRSAPSPAQAARDAFGARLREIRLDAGLTGRGLAAVTGWQASKISRIEHATRTPSADDVRAWVTHCGAEEQLSDLLAALRAVEGMYVEFSGRERAGFRHIQQQGAHLYDRTRRFRIYEPGVIPGLFQTPEYAEARLRRIAEVRGVPDDVAEAVRIRMARQRVLDANDRRFAVVLEEWALSARIGSAEVMAAQLAHLLTVCVRHNVSLGVVPMSVERTMWQSPGFWMFDETQVNVETPTAELTITQPREVQMYARVFAELAGMATVGASARALIVAAIERLEVQTVRQPSAMASPVEDTRP
ncbi:helix-turn-helix protein [Krasilnikovia cinnamomea]|uniref:Helix-turn-helix protein n=1 Tax=Krasilnikovia cinnamomea TaxID=349313 RepID=A0A4Q7ZUP4_9ACTN|nr:helix-turn-helix transcriptional regulator [Krasilnikovia cinnamomea]RZU54631.1 helix-turn-helix protein [Krasilnikovia cinnamomea]